MTILTGGEARCRLAAILNHHTQSYDERSVHPVSTAPTPQRELNTATPERVLEAIVTGINSGDLDSLIPLYESEAAFATQPGTLAHGTAGVGEALTGFISMNGKLDLEVTRVLEVDDLALVIGDWTFNGTGPDGQLVQLAARNADVLRRQPDGTWRFVIDNPWGTD
jgi:ketosteroid isomerase-like protein